MTWRRARRRLYAVIGALAVAGFAVLTWLDFIGSLHDYITPAGPLAHFVNLFIVATVALVAVLAVYSRDLNREIVRRREAEGTAVQLALYDPLTGLPNRRNFVQTFDQWLDVAMKERSRLALVVFDVDRFRVVNDLHGHSGGDRVLQVVARRLTKVVRPPQFVARLGADEFGILIAGGDESQLLRLIRRLLSEVRAPIDLGDGDIRVTGSIGVALAPQDGTQREVLMQRADLSIDRAKKRGRNSYAAFDAVVDTEARHRLTLEAELPRALSDGEIVPYFQPFVELASGEVVGFEVLARWNHPEHGLIAGEELVAVADDAGLIGRLFAHILEEASTVAMEWPDPVQIAVNASPTQLGERAMIGIVLESLERTGLPASRLEIEITEDALVQDFPLALEIVSALKEVGIRISLDDFGTGYSSLRHLHEIPIDKIKIDRSFVVQRRTGQAAATVVDLVIVLGHSLGLTVTAEGIETLDDALWLKERGCDLGQGYLFSEPVPAADVPDLLKGAKTPRRGAII
ncbi:putative bifunctional diguanylate cyclase/phosphodiesterase [Amorphus orientalis]|uniref:Diguanylate cyclase (GGDEF)-like protein n=1 Tax=Amorphus orientalis TaxID=649198 RepID=A0AAE3VRT8_9HYPH|nr:EAL domain-containing protein [Amorphus orientalis]MDQ0317030.1 diguanylate cyclase (GGDEF)-like protein [Amorphus orientalis]